MLKAGKLDNKLLEKIVFDKIKYKRPEVITRPGIGEDCAVIDYGTYECVLSTDPITAAVEKIGSLAVHISCNDIASNGIEPLGIMLTLLLPEGITKADIEKIMEEAGEAAEELQIEIIGGHTEITRAVNQPVIVSTAVGRGEKWASQHAGNMREGDYILMTKKAALEGTGIIATDFADELKGVLTPEELKHAADMLTQVSVVKEGVVAGKIGTAGMHDITEGGVLGAVYEMCEIAGTGAEVYADDVPIDSVTRKVCEHFDLDPLRLISSGSMMIMAHDDKKEEICVGLKNAGVEVSVIGKITSKDKGIKLFTGGKQTDVGAPGSDEIYKVGE